MELIILWYYMSIICYSRTSLSNFNSTPLLYIIVSPLTLANLRVNFVCNICTLLLQSVVGSSIETYQNSTEGTEIFFRCNPGFVPAGRMRAVCAADGRWYPDPAGLVCTGEIVFSVGCNCIH